MPSAKHLSAPVFDENPPVGDLHLRLHVVCLELLNIEMPSGDAAGGRNFHQPLGFKLAAGVKEWERQSPRRRAEHLEDGILAQLFGF